MIFSSIFWRICCRSTTLSADTCPRPNAGKTTSPPPSSLALHSSRAFLFEIRRISPVALPQPLAAPMHLGHFCKTQRSVVILNTHLKFSNDVQVRSAHLIRQRLHGHADKEPIVIMGDSNAPPESPCYAEFTTRKERIPSIQKCIYAPIRGYASWFKGKNEGAPIDWILFRGQLKVDQPCVITRRFAIGTLRSLFLVCPVFADASSERRCRKSNICFALLRLVTCGVP